MEIDIINYIIAEIDKKISEFIKEAEDNPIIIQFEINNDGTNALDIEVMSFDSEILFSFPRYSLEEIGKRVILHMTENSNLATTYKNHKYILLKRLQLGKADYRSWDSFIILYKDKEQLKHLEGLNEINFDLFKTSSCTVKADSVDLERMSFRKANIKALENALETKKNLTRRVTEVEKEIEERMKDFTTEERLLVELGEIDKL